MIPDTKNLRPFLYVLLFVGLPVLQGFSSGVTPAGGRLRESVSFSRVTFPHGGNKNGIAFQTTKTEGSPAVTKKNEIISPLSVGEGEREGEEDSIERLAQDIATVLLKLRPDYYDSTIPKMYHQRRSFTNTWTVTMWKRHRSRMRYIHYLTSFPTSRILRRIFPQLSVLIIWSMFATRLSNRLTASGAFSLTPLSLVSTFVAALLTLRSNQALSRLNEGRNVLGQMVLYTRDLSQLIASNIYPTDPALGLKAIRHVALFSWLLKGFLRGKEVNGSDEDIIRAMLPSLQPGLENTVSPDAAYILQRGRKRPVAVITRLRQIFTHMHRKNQLTTSEASRLDTAVQQLNNCIMVTERIQASPIPPVYTAHGSRLLMLYLGTLPFALRGTNLLNDFGTVAATAAIGFAMLGLDEISHLTEEPFRLMPLYHLSKNCMKDCGDALVCQPPPLFGEDSNPGKPYSRPPYWSDNVQ
jgi:predicted membrane chloride channel (bestrophin family)